MTHEIRSRLNASVLWSGEAANLRDAVVQAVAVKASLRGANLHEADLRGADLRGADLSGANLRWADLSGADLRWADLRGADLSGADLSGASLRGANLHEADLRGANLRAIRDDLYAVLDTAVAEVPALLAALSAGQIDGSTYTGTCACLCGTIANARGCDYHDLAPNIDRPSERWFLAIRPGDTPTTSAIAQITSEWIEAWQSRQKEAVCQ